MTTDGIVLATFTPLRGWTAFMRGYFASAMMPGTEDDTVDIPAKTAVTSTLEGAAAEAEEADFAVQSDQVVVRADENPYAAVQPRFIIGATWDDAPHLTEKVKAQQWASMLPLSARRPDQGHSAARRRRGLSDRRTGFEGGGFCHSRPLVARVRDGRGRGAQPTAAVFCALESRRPRCCM